MNKYTAEVTILVEIEAPDLNDAEEMIDDHYGRGSGGEGVEVVGLEYVINHQPKV